MKGNVFFTCCCGSRSILIQSIQKKRKQVWHREVATPNYPKDFAQFHIAKVPMPNYAQTLFSLVLV
jgi:hypothetical protein